MDYVPTKFKAEDSVYNKGKADYAVAFIENLCHTKGVFSGKKSVFAIIRAFETCFNYGARVE